jgi:hypothetical protein
METLRIGGGQGFYGDTWRPALEMAERADVDVIAFDCLSELTLSILQKQRRRDPTRGFTLDLVPLLAHILPAARRGRIRLVTNSGGANPPGAAAAALAVAGNAGDAGRGLRIATVTGDDLLDRLAGLGDLPNLDTGEPLGDDRLARAVSANAYLGSDAVLAGLDTGADLVITGRVTDSALWLGPLRQAFGWADDDWDRLAAGVVCGHLLECAGQVTGGNFAAGWDDVPDLDRIGYPIAEVRPDGEFVLTKTPGTGGRVSVGTVTEQLLYEIGDPAAYLTPDVVVDLTGIELRDDGPDRVRVTGARGCPRPDRLKAVIGYADGWLGEAMVAYTWPKAAEKARAAGRILRAIIDRHGPPYREFRADVVGVDALHGPAARGAGASNDPAEVLLRVAMHCDERADADRLVRELVPLGLNGPPTACYAGSAPRPRELLAIWPTLVDRDAVGEVAVAVEEVSA